MPQFVIAVPICNNGFPIFLALMSSGLNGQCFKFHGYLPIEKQKRIDKIKLLEKESQKLNQSQIFMETPYRNEQMLQDLINHCSHGTLLCVARNITGENELIKTQTIGAWRGERPSLNKQPTVFVLYSERML